MGSETSPPMVLMVSNPFVFHSAMLTHRTTLTCTRYIFRRVQQESRPILHDPADCSASRTNTPAG